MVTRRQRKVADLIHEELSDMLARRVSDPRLAGVTITAVEVSVDLEHAKVFYSVLTDEASEIQAVQAGLERARGFLRHGLAEALDLRLVPDLTFQLDRSLAEGQRIEALIRSLHQTDNGREGA